jgi:hypothetical protein
VAPGRAGRGAGEQGGQFDVLDRGPLLDELERLEDEPDPPAPQPGQTGLGQAVDAVGTEPDLAGGRPLEPSEQVQQARLATAARADDRDALAPVDVEVDVVDRAPARRRGRGPWSGPCRQQ